MRQGGEVQEEHAKQVGHGGDPTNAEAVVFTRDEEYSGQQREHGVPAEPLDDEKECRRHEAVGKHR